MEHNCIYLSDNLPILRDQIADDVADLIYLDPPFNSRATYAALLRQESGSRVRTPAFDDVWHWDVQAEAALQELVTVGSGDLAALLPALRAFLGGNDLMAYLAMMAVRLVELRRVLKPTGSIYLHCDPTASHYLKLLMDAVLGANRLQNEIIWSYKRYTAASTRFQRLHDVILFYSRGDKHTFHCPREEYGANSGVADSHYKQDETGQWYRWQKRRGQEPYKVRLSEGRRLGDVWDIPRINASAKQRLGYPTQKPEALLERIIRASSNEGDLVLDPFCGSGTTLVVAERLRRRWIGIDASPVAVELARERLGHAWGGDPLPPMP